MKDRLAEGREIVDKIAESGAQLVAPARDHLLKELTAAYAEGTVEGMAALQRRIGEWRDRKQFVTTWLPAPSGNVPEKLMLIVTELAEAMEAFRHLKPEFRELLAKAEPGARIETPEGMEEQWVWYENFCEELADTQVRLFELADGLGIDLGMETCGKMAVNETRAIKHGKEC